MVLEARMSLDLIIHTCIFFFYILKGFNNTKKGLYVICKSKLSPNKYRNRFIDVGLCNKLCL